MYARFDGTIEHLLLSLTQHITAGKSIGKHVFLSRSTVSPIVDQKDTTNCKAKLHELEMKFHKSLFQETEAANSLMAFVPQPVSASYPIQVRYMSLALHIIY